MKFLRSFSQFQLVAEWVSMCVLPSINVKKEILNQKLVCSSSNNSDEIKRDQSTNTRQITHEKFSRASFSYCVMAFCVLFVLLMFSQAAKSCNIHFFLRQYENEMGRRMESFTAKGQRRIIYKGKIAHVNNHFDIWCSNKNSFIATGYNVFSDFSTTLPLNTTKRETERKTKNDTKENTYSNIYTLIRLQ